MNEAMVYKIDTNMLDEYYVYIFIYTNITINLQILQSLLFMTKLNHTSIRAYNTHGIQSIIKAIYAHNILLFFFCNLSYE